MGRRLTAVLTMKSDNGCQFQSAENKDLLAQFNSYRYPRPNTIPNTTTESSGPMAN
jgi:hypothetical protein